MDTFFRADCIPTLSRSSGLALLFLLFVAVAPCQAETPRGMYGVSADQIENIERHIPGAGLTSVFAPPDQQTIEQLHKAGLQIYLTLNVFGGTESWEKHPDSVPITASGERLSAHLGGICPTHYAWREERLTILADWLQKFATVEGIDGVWLDFIRYPGRWEEKKPEIPDTCYCPRCLKLFQVEQGVKIPANLSTEKTAGWIHAHAQLQWQQWKKEQITSFMREARSVINKKQAAKQIKLGAFLVPWMQGEHQGEILTHLAQDASQLARYADILSPMVYHEMVGQPAEWTGKISAYLGDMTRKTVWPIIQAGNVSAEEFARSVQSVSQSGAQGLLVYTLSDMQENLWPLLGDFNLQKNLLPNPQFALATQADQQTPSFWKTGEHPVQDSRYLFQPGKGTNNGLLGITCELDRQGTWKAPLPPCDPQKSYRFSADLFRQDLRENTYPEIVIWGQRHLLNDHRVSGRFQRVLISVRCPQDLRESERFFSFANTYPGTTFWLRNPLLVEEAPHQIQEEFAEKSNFYPIGAYGASIDTISQMKAMGLNSAVMPMNKKAVDACLQNDMHCLLSVPHDSENLLVTINELEDRIRKGKFSFYVNDEPEIHSFPRWKAADIQRILHDRFPGIPTSMAIVRPQGIPAYADSADLFMLDQYPVPSMPMNWLSDSLDQAAGYVGRNRLQSVIQAFGGSEWAKFGWPRLPTFMEMNCLSFLSVIHGSKGIYFYTFPIIAKDKQGKKDFQQVITRLQKISPWLKAENQPEPVNIEMLSTNRVDPAGKPAVHCALKEKDSVQMLLCANVLPTYTKASASVPDGRQAVWQEFFDGGKALTVNGGLILDFLPFEVKVFVNPAQ